MGSVLKYSGELYLRAYDSNSFTLLRYDFYQYLYMTKHLYQI
jgi:hypothetical protein